MPIACLRKQILYDVGTIESIVQDTYNIEQ